MPILAYLSIVVEITKLLFSLNHSGKSVPPPTKKFYKVFLKISCLFDYFFQFNIWFQVNLSPFSKGIVDLLNCFFQK